MILGGDYYPYDYKEVVALCRVRSEELRDLSPEDFVAAGLMTRSSHLLRAAEILVDNRYGDSVAVLLRPVIENVATAFWLLNDPASNLPIFLGDHKRNLERLTRWNPTPEREMELRLFVKQLADWAIVPGDEPLPGMSTRAAALWSDLRPMYKEISAELHASARSSLMSLSWDLRYAELAQDFGSLIPQDWLAYAAYMTLALAKNLHDRHDWDGRVDVDELFDALEGWRPRGS